MSLNYDLTNVKDWEEIDPARRQAVIFFTIMVGMGDIKGPIDAGRFHKRLQFLEKLNGPFAHDTSEDGKPKPHYFEYDEIYRFVGLHTNVPEETPTQFLKRHTKHLKKEW